MKTSQSASIALVVVSLCGTAIAAYLTSVHYASAPLACSDKGLVNCAQVLTSKYSEVLGLPWSVGGIAWFAVSGILAAGALAKRPEPELLQPAQVAWSLLGLAVVFYLVGVELIAVKHICIWCTSMHALIVATLLLTLFRTPEVAPETMGSFKSLDHVS